MLLFTNRATLKKSFHSRRLRKESNILTIMLWTVSDKSNVVFHTVQVVFVISCKQINDSKICTELKISKATNDSIDWWNWQSQKAPIMRVIKKDCILYFVAVNTACNTVVCHNGGTCIAGIGSAVLFTCVCRTGYSGDNCQGIRR